MFSTESFWRVSCCGVKDQRLTLRFCSYSSNLEQVSRRHPWGLNVYLFVVYYGYPIVSCGANVCLLWFPIQLPLVPCIFLAILIVPLIIIAVDLAVSPV